MKNVISTLSILIILLGAGLIIPRIIPAAAPLRAHSQEDIQKETVNGNAAGEISGETGFSETKNTSPENTEISSASDEIQEKNRENFPIKTAETDNAFSDKDSVNQSVISSDVDSIEPVVDNTKTSEETTTVQEASASMPTAPAAPEKEVIRITFKPVSYSRWVTAPLNMRKGPGREYAVITSIPPAESVQVTSLASNGWAKVSYAGKEGYVSGRYLSETEVKKPAAPAPESKTSYESYRMYVGGKTITYRNGGIADGQRIIDSNSRLISTWGGAEVYSGNDGYNTHFIGHNPGIFSVLTQIGNGSAIIVTDGNGRPTTYKVTRIFTVDDHAYNAKDGENYYNYMVSRSGGEVITLQTCLGTNKNLVIRAEK